MPLFSVVIPTYNRADLIVETLASVAAQECTDYEVLVVDDGSTDNTREVLATFGHGVRLLTQANKGPGPARNLGTLHARGDYIAFLDSDDLWFPWTLATYARAIHVGNMPALAAGPLVEFVHAGELPLAGPAPLHYRAFADYLATSHEGIFFGTSFVARREALLDVGGFGQERMNMEDHDLALRLGTARGFVYVDQPPTRAYRRHDQSEVLDLPKTVSGIRYLLDQERKGNYPGGPERRRERHRILAMHARSCSFHCLRGGSFKAGWDLYRQTFSWNLGLWRWRFLAAFPLLALSACGRSRRAQPQGEATG
jgi:glycosyltransferase involved in cell wall biosynthesis